MNERTDIIQKIVDEIAINAEKENLDMVNSEYIISKIEGYKRIILKEVITRLELDKLIKVH